MLKMTKTIFEKIIDRELPSKIVYEDDKCIAIEDIAPKAPIHILIIPKKAIQKLSETKKDDEVLLGHLMMVVKKVAEQLDVQDAFNVVINLSIIHI
mgnify:CR=1 FL=1